MKLSRVSIAAAGMVLTFGCAARSFAADGAVTGYGWSSMGGWVNFSQARVTDTTLTGYAWDSNYGWINFAPTQGGVRNDGVGNLSGYAWSQGGGWVSFDGITIDANGRFHGVTAASPVYGRITFDCTYCEVSTAWRRATSPSGVSIGKESDDLPQVPAAVPAFGALAPVSVLRAAVGGSFGVATSSPENFSDAVKPDQLFDIRLIVDARTIVRAEDLVARVTFESFGRVPTLVRLSFVVRDATGAERYRKDDSVTIETEGSLTVRFEDLSLPDGSYTLELRTLYNKDVTDTFTIPFDVSPAPLRVWWWYAILAGVPLAMLLLGLYRRRTRERKVAQHA